MIEGIPYTPYTPEEWQYWGGFFGEALRPTIDRQTHHPRSTARNPLSRVYYEPRLFVFDRRQTHLEHVRQNFGGRVKEQPPRSEFVVNDFGGFPRENGFQWRLDGTENILPLLRELQPYLISQYELVQIMVDFLSAKQERAELYRGSLENILELAESRENEEANFRNRFLEAKEGRYLVRTPLTAANKAGVLDASGAISIVRSERSDGKTNYSPNLEIHSDSQPLLEVFSDFHNGRVVPARRVGSGYSERKFVYIITKSDDIRTLLETTLPYLILQRRQAELVITFLDVQESLGGGSKPQGWRTRQGELSDVLDKYSNRSVDLVTILREGFYSDVYRLNHQ